MAETNLYGPDNCTLVMVSTLVYSLLPTVPVTIFRDGNDVLSNNKNEP